MSVVMVRSGGRAGGVTLRVLLEERGYIAWMDSRLPGEVARWVDRLAGLCRRPALGAAGLYVTGSISTGGFHAAVSDLDVVLVVTSAVDAPHLERLVADLLEVGLPPAAGGLDLDLFTRHGLQHPDPDPGWRSWIRWTADGDPVVWGGGLQLSDWAPALAIARDRAITVFGPPALATFAPISRRLVLQACREELAGWDHYQPFWSLPGGVLTACRIWWYWAEGSFGSKVDAGRWALGLAEGDEGRLIQSAVDHQLRGGGPDLAASAVIAFVRRIAGLVGAA